MHIQAMYENDIKGMQARIDYNDSQNFYEEMMAKQATYVGLQMCCAHMEKMKGRLAKEMLRLNTCTSSYKGLLEEHDLVATDGAPLVIEGVEAEDRFDLGEETRMVAIRIKEKVDKANMLCQKQIYDSLNNGMEKNEAFEYDLHQMANCLLKEKDVETTRVFRTVMSKFVLKGEDVRYTELANEVEKTEPKDPKLLGARPKEPKLLGARPKESKPSGNKKKMSGL